MIILSAMSIILEMLRRCSDTSYPRLHPIPLPAIVLAMVQKRSTIKWKVRGQSGAQALQIHRGRGMGIMVRTFGTRRIRANNVWPSPAPTRTNRCVDTMWYWKHHIFRLLIAAVGWFIYSYYAVLGLKSDTRPPSAKTAREFLVTSSRRSFDLRCTCAMEE